LLSHARSGDVIIIYKLDRLGRSVINIIKLISLFEKKGIELFSITEHIDTKSPMGKVMYRIGAIFAELERDLIIERSAAGREAAMARGIVGGRPYILKNEQIENLRLIHSARKTSVAEMCRMFDIKKTTLYRYLKKEL
jgi:DNA invertase Pin-like site-specific DNA recombinase